MFVSFSAGRFVFLLFTALALVLLNRLDLVQGQPFAVEKREFLALSYVRGQSWCLGPPDLVDLHYALEPIAPASASLSLRRCHDEAPNHRRRFVPFRPGEASHGLKAFADAVRNVVPPGASYSIEPSLAGAIKTDTCIPIEAKEMEEIDFREGGNVLYEGDRLVELPSRVYVVAQCCHEIQVLTGHLDAQCQTPLFKYTTMYNSSHDSFCIQGKRPDSLWDRLSQRPKDQQ